MKPEEIRKIEEYGGMVFQLPDKGLFGVDKKTLEGIAGKIVMNMIVDKEIKVNMMRDSTLDKVEKLQEILKSDPNINEDIKNQYYKKILEILSGTDMKEVSQSETP